MDGFQGQHRTAAINTYLPVRHVHVWDEVRMQPAHPFHQDPQRT